MCLSSRILGGIVLPAAQLLAVPLLVVPLLVGCTGETAGDKVAGRTGVAGVNALVRFEYEGTLKLSPGEVSDVSVIGKPGAPYAMTFLLIGDSLDASLDRTEVVAEEDGRATVQLRAPNGATYFAVHVTIKDGPTATLNVAVSDEGFGTLSIVPDYDGVRETREWVASVVAGTTCDMLAPTFPSDPEGPTPVASDPGLPIVIEDVPVGPNLAVFVRAGHYMWGCADASGLVANESVEVKVRIVDAPLDLGSADLDVTLDLEPDAAEWATLVVAQRDALSTAFFAGDTQEQLLISAMKAAFTGDVQEFTIASASWDISGHFAGNGVDLQQSIATLVDEGLLAEPMEITAAVSGVDNAPDQAVLTLLTFGSATPGTMQVPVEYVTSFTADADDTVRLGGTLFWMPSRYFGHLAEQAGFAQFAGYTDFAQVLGDIAFCDTLVLPGLSQCAGACVESLCEAALSARWQIALASSAETLNWGELPFESSGGSRFDDTAVVTGFTGSWLGELVASDDKATVSGAAEAVDADTRPD